MKTDKREALSKMVGLTMDEQRLCRIEGVLFATRALRSEPCKLHISAAWFIEGKAERRWGVGWDA